VLVLLVHDHGPAAAVAQRALAGRAELRCVAGLEPAIAALRTPALAPDLVVVELEPRAFAEPAAASGLRAAAGAVPVVVGLDGALALLDRLRPRTVVDGDLGAVVEALIEQQRGLGEAIAAQRGRQAAEIERAVAAAVEAAVARAAEQLVRSLGLEDGEGLKLAVRFARGWEDAKGRFLSALATGVAGAFLLALGAGIASVVRGAGSK
jgi:hypothetical protein